MAFRTQHRVQESGRDVVREMLNIFSGALMERIFGADSKPRMGVPSIYLASPEDHERSLETASCKITLLTEEFKRVDIAAYME